jgi:hypothetical protein
MCFWSSEEERKAQIIDCSSFIRNGQHWLRRRVLQIAYARQLATRAHNGPCNQFKDSQKGPIYGPIEEWQSKSKFMGYSLLSSKHIFTYEVHTGVKDFGGTVMCFWSSRIRAKSSDKIGLQLLHSEWPTLAPPSSSPNRLCTAYETRARDSGWVHSPKAGVYTLLPNWRDVV